MTRDVRRVLVVGTGHIGGSLAGLVRRTRSGVEVAGVDPDLAGAESLVARGWLSSAAGPDRLLDEVSRADLVVLAAPPVEIVRLLGPVAGALAPGAVLTDVASVKGPVLAEARRVVTDGAACFAGGHPIGGTERRGAGHADPSVLEGAVWCVVPWQGAADPAAVRIARFLESCSMRPVVLDDATHDRLLATTSHLPHVLAFALARLAGRAAEVHPELDRLAGPSFRGATRVAASDPALWNEVLRLNRPAVAGAIEAMIEELRAAARAIESEDETLIDFLEVARAQAQRPGGSE